MSHSVINDVIQVKSVPVDTRGNKQEKFYFSFRSDDGQVGSFFAPIPAGLNELREKTIKWLLGTYQSAVGIDVKLQRIFDYAGSISGLELDFKRNLESAFPNTATRNRTLKSIDEAVGENPGLEVPPGVQSLADLRREIKKRNETLDGFLRKNHLGFSVLNDERGALDLHLDILQTGNGAAGIRGICPSDRSIDDIASWTTAYSDTESKYFNNSKYKIPPWFVEHVRQRPQVFGQMTDEQIISWALNEFKARRETMTHIGLLYRKDGHYSGEIHTIHNTKLSDLTAVIDGVSMNFKIFSYEMGKEDVERKYDEFRAALAAAKSQRTINNIYQRFGVVKRENNNEERIKQDIKSHFEEMSMRDGAQESARTNNPFWWHYHNSRYDIEEMKSVPTTKSSIKSWTVDSLWQQPRKYGTIDFMEKEHIRGAVIFDTLDIALNFFPELRTRKLDSLVTHLANGNIPAITIYTGNEQIEISQEGPKSLSHADINPNNLLADYGDMGSRKNLLYYLAGDVVWLAWLDGQLAGLKNTAIRIKKATGLGLNDILHSPKSMAEASEREFYLKNRQRMNPYFKFRRQMEMGRLRPEFKKYMRPQVPEDLIEAGNHNVMTAVYIPSAFFAKDILQRKHPELEGIVNAFDLQGQQREQLAYEKYLGGLMNEIFFRRFVIEKLNDEYNEMRSRIAIKRTDFEAFSEGLKGRFEETFKLYRNAANALISSAEQFFVMLNIKAGAKNLEAAVIESAKKLRLQLGTEKRKPNYSGNQPTLFGDDYSWLEISHPEVYALKTLPANIDFDESLSKIYRRFKSALERYQEFFVEYREGAENAFQKISGNFGGRLEDLHYMNYVRRELQKLAVIFNWDVDNFMGFQKRIDAGHEMAFEVIRGHGLKVAEQSGPLLYLAPCGSDAVQALKNSGSLIYLGDVQMQEAHPRRMRKN